MIRFFVCLLLLLFNHNLSAQTNFGFESGNTSSWTISNNLGAANWSNGSGVAVVTGLQHTPGGGKSWTVTPYGNYMLSIQPGSGAPTFDSMISSLGLTADQNTAIRNMLISQSQTGGGDPTPTNASWAKRDITLQAGVTYTIAWQYLSTDYTPFNDGSIMTLTHKTDSGAIPILNNVSSKYSLLGFTNLGTGNYATDSYGSTGWQVATFTVPVTGEWVMGFASFNLGDTILSPILLIDEMQGNTLLNNQTFTPIQPNAGSSAPPPPSGNTLCCGGTSTPFNSNTAFTNRAQTFSATGDSRVTIEQIGNTNAANVAQVGARNFTQYRATGSNNTANITQNSNNNTNYIEATITGNSNTTTVNQNSTGGAKGVLLNTTNNNNSVSIQQQGSGSHYAEVTLSGSDKTVDITQSGSASHMARIELHGGATSISTTQSGSIQHSYSITHTCATVSCAAITVTQGQ